MLKIITAPDLVLAQPAKRIPKVNLKILKLIEAMKKTLVKTSDPKGVGLAAPQVGKSLRVFIAKPTDNSRVIVFINPEIISRSSKLDYVKRPVRQSLMLQASAGGPKKDTSLPASQAERGGLGKRAFKKLEGCLSLPNIWGPVLRNSSVSVSYLDEYGKSHQKKFSNFMATIIQHETDHLNGILFPKRVLEQKGKLYKSKKNRKGEDEFEEIEL